MAISVATSPAAVALTGTGTATAAFSPGANTFLVAAVEGALSTGTTVTVSGGSLTWTQRATNSDGLGAINELWTAPCAAGAAGITVTTNGAWTAGQLKVYVLNDVLLASPIGNTGTGTSTTNNVTVSGYTSSVANSRGFCGAIDTSAQGLPVSTDDELGWTSAAVQSGMSITKFSNTGTSGTSVTFNLDAAGTSAPAWRWAAIEIKPNPAAQSVTATGIATAEAWGSATVSLVGTATISPTGIPSDEAWGSHTVALAQTITLTGVASGEAWGSSQLNQSVNLTGISSAEAWGSTQLNMSVQTIGIASAEAWGSSAVSVNQSLTLTGIASGEAWGSAVVSNVTPSGISIATSPAQTAVGTNPTTASFTAPAGSLLVASVTPNSTGTMSNTGTALTWTLRSTSGGSRIFTAPNPTLQSSITATTTGANIALKIWVVTGADLSSPVGATNSGSTTTNNATVAVYTSTVNNSRGFCAAGELNGLGPGATSTDTFAVTYLGSAVAGMSLNKAANTTPSATAVTFNMDGNGTSAADWNWAAVEILPAASVNQTVTATGIASGEAWGSSQLNMSVGLTGIPTAEAWGALAVQASQTLTLTGIPSGEAWGSSTLIRSQIISLTGIPSVEAWGTAAFQYGSPQTLTLSGIVSSEAWGTLAVRLRSRYVLIPPSIQETPVAYNRLMSRFGLHRGITIIKTNGVYSQVRYPAQTEMEAAERVYMGGHRHPLTDEEYAELVDAGFGAYIISEPIE